MPQALKVLIVETSNEDAELLVQELKRAGFDPEWQRVETEADYLSRLQEGINLVLADFQMPQFSGLRALELLKQGGLDVPFILVSDVAGEDTAVKAMKHGATDYLTKSRLASLGESVSQALEAGRVRAERKRVEQKLLLQSTALETADDAIVITDASGVMLWVNPAFTRQSGYSSDEALGQTLRLLKSGKHGDGFYKNLWATILAGKTWRGCLTNRRKDGSFYVDESTITPVRSKEGVVTHFVTILNDVTERQSAEGALKEAYSQWSASEERFRQLAENIHEVFWMTDVTSRALLYISPAYETIWGRTCASAYDSTHVWTESIHAMDRVRVVRAVNEKQASGTYDETYRIIRPDGSTRWIRDRAFPVKDKTGTLSRMVGVAEDITERKQFEEQFLRAQRLESVGMLAAGIAHDLNNILTPIGMMAPLLRTSVSAPEDLRLLDTLERCSARGAGLVRQILSFVHGIGGEPRVVQVKHLINDIIGVISETFPKSIVLQDEAPNEPWPILANPTQIHQVLLNLCVNARDAMPEGGTLVLRVENLILDADSARLIEGASPGPWLVLHVADTGTGIPAEALANIWEPFFTTKSAEEGTGLGLSTVRGIVEAHLGFITVATVLGQGTTFRVYLPAEKSAVVVDAVATLPTPDSVNSELILLVDDEEFIRETVGSILKRAGYRVLIASDGREALTLFNARMREIALVITDRDMPIVDGEGLAQAIHEKSPAMKLLLMSGLGSSDEAGKICGETFGDAFIAKPFTVEALLKSVEQLLLELSSRIVG